MTDNTEHTRVLLRIQKRINNELVYQCPACFEQLHRGQKCPHCGRRAVVVDLSYERQEQDEQLDDWQNWRN